MYKRQTPDYALSPISEQDVEFRFDVSGHLEPQLLAEVQSGFAGRPGFDVSDVIEVNDDVEQLECNASQTTVSLKHTEQASEDKDTEYEQKDADMSDTLELSQPVELTIHSKDSSEAHGQYWTRVESAPVMLAPKEEDMWQNESNAHLSSADQQTDYSTLRTTYEKCKRTGKRSVVISLIC